MSGVDDGSPSSGPDVWDTIGGILANVEEATMQTRYEAVQKLHAQLKDAQRIIKVMTEDNVNLKNTAQILGEELRTQIETNKTNN